jgi:small subunit ribosomal protein S1
VEKKEGFGIFVNLAPGITGLLPKSKIAASDKAAVIDSLKPGASITVTVDSVNSRERKISLGTGDGADDQGWKDYTGGTSGSMGSLGDKLQQALSEQKKGDR